MVLRDGGGATKLGGKIKTTHLIFLPHTVVRIVKCVSTFSSSKKRFKLFKFNVTLFETFLLFFFL